MNTAVLHATRVGPFTLRTERDFDTGTFFYYVDDVLVDVNRYPEAVRAAAPGPVIYSRSLLWRCHAPPAPRAVKRCAQQQTESVAAGTS